MHRRQFFRYSTRLVSLLHVAGLAYLCHQFWMMHSCQGNCRATDLRFNELLSWAVAWRMMFYPIVLNISRYVFGEDNLEEETRGSRPYYTLGEGLERSIKLSMGFFGIYALVMMLCYAFPITHETLLYPQGSGQGLLLFALGLGIGYRVYVLEWRVECFAFRSFEAYLRGDLEEGIRRHEREDILD